MQKELITSGLLLAYHEGQMEWSRLWGKVCSITTNTKSQDMATVTNFHSPLKENLPPTLPGEKVKYGLVLGCPRSGTTFLMTCLNALPNSECVSGHLLPVPIPHIVNCSLDSEVYAALSRTVEFAFRDYLESIAQARVPAVARWLNGAMTNQELIQALRRKRKIERLIYKEPFLSFAPEFIYHSLPNCRIIHIYRDGRDAADSLVRRYDVLTDEKLMTLSTAEMPLGRKYDHRYVPWWVKDGSEAKFLDCTPYVRAIWMWKEMVRRCHDFFSLPEVIASERVMLLRYEDLVSNSLQYGESVAEHLGSTMNNQLQRKFKQAKTSSIGIHKRRDEREVEAGENIAKTELELYGYL